MRDRCLEKGPVGHSHRDIESRAALSRAAKTAERTLDRVARTRYLDLDHRRRDEPEQEYNTDHNNAHLCYLCPRTAVTYVSGPYI